MKHSTWSVGGEQRVVQRKDRNRGGRIGNTETSLYQYGKKWITAFCDRRTKRNKCKTGGARERVQGEVLCVWMSVGMPVCRCRGSVRDVWAVNTDSLC